jgi:CheY-like chemotaxis protein
MIIQTNFLSQLRFIEACNGLEAINKLKEVQNQHDNSMNSNRNSDQPRSRFKENECKNSCKGVRVIFMDYDMPVMNGL